MGIQLNGTSGTDVVSAVDGSLTVEGLTISGDFNIADKIIHSGDTNTAIRFPAADTITAETAGSERLRITSTGNVGINTTNPTSDGGTTLEVYNATNPTIRLNDGGQYKSLFQLRGNDLEIRGSNGNVEFYTGNADGASSTEKLRIDSGGRLFTGASQTLLDSIAGTIHIDGAGNGGRIALRGTTTSAGGGLGEIFAYWNNTKVAGIIALAGADNNNKDDGHLTFYTRPDTATGVQERFRITSAGKVIIRSQGAAASDGYAALEIRQNTGGKHLVLASNSATSSTNEVMLGFKLHPSGQDERIKAAIICRGTGSNDYGQPSFMSFCLDNAGDNGNATVANDEKLRIDSNGDLGLGVAPNNVGSLRTLHIKGPSNEGAAIRLQADGDTPDSDDFTIYKNYAAGYLRINGTDPLIAYLNGAERLHLDSGGRLGMSVASAAQLASSKMLTIRPGNDDGIRIVRPGDNNNSPNIHLDLTTTTSGSSLRSGGEAYTTKFKSYNCDMLFNSYLGGGTGGIIRLMTSDGSSGTTRYWQIDEKGKTEHRSRSTSVKTHEFTYTDGAGGSTQTVTLCTLSNYSGSSTAVAQITYVGSYGLANDYVASGGWICGIRRANSNAGWAFRNTEYGNNGSSVATLDLAWNNSGQLQAITAGAWMGWTVHVTVTTYNFDLTVNV